MAEVSKQRKTDKPTVHFLDDVLIEIFLKLPVRSLFLFRSVSKHWLNLIQTPNFINLHINRPINNQNDHQPLLIMRTAESVSRFSKRKIVRTLLSCNNDDDVALKVLSPSMASRGLALKEGKMHLIGPCNGLFCLTDTFDVVLFNPATRRCKKVPHSPFISKSRDFYDSDYVRGYFCYVGFGFDPVSNDYKIVTFNKIRRSASSREVHFKVRIFSLSTDSWRELDGVMPGGKMSTIHSGSVFFNGALHWLGGNNDNFSSILVFDLDTETFKRFELNNKYLQEDSILVFLSVLNESLTMIVKKEYNYMDPDVVFEIWVMKEYGVKKSWVKLYNIGNMGIERPLSFSKDEEFLAENFHCQLVSYNLKTKTIKEYKDHGVRGSFHAFRYRESLVSLK